MSCREKKISFIALNISKKLLIILDETKWHKYG